jgi:hypothetical protein
MRVRIRERANQLRVAAAHHETAADSLGRHVTEVDTRKEAIEGVEQRATSLTREAAARIAALKAAEEHREPDAEDVTLAAFVPPPAGHKDWLNVELPGL